MAVIGFNQLRNNFILSHRAVYPNPWELIEEHFQKGQCFIGAVVNCVKYGFFIKLPTVKIFDSLETFNGLLHRSEIVPTTGEESQFNKLQIGDSLKVFIKDIDIKNKKISLTCTMTRIESMGSE